MITTICKLSYSSRTVPPIVQAVQGDTGRTVRFDVTDFTIPAGAEATYFIEKPSGEAVYNAATISGNSILCELTAQSLAEPGENKMQVRVILDDEIVTSFKVCLLVSTFWGIDAIESSTEMNIFDKAVEQATEDFQEQAEQIVEEVIESIPADYTALTEEVDELNERLGNFNNDLIRQNYSWALDYKVGSQLFDVSNNALVPSSYKNGYRVATNYQYPILLNKGTVLKVPSNMALRYAYSANNTSYALNDGAWLVGETVITLENTGYYAFLISSYVNGSIDTVQITDPVNFASDIAFYYPTLKQIDELNNIVMSFDAWKIGFSHGTIDVQSNSWSILTYGNTRRITSDIDHPFKLNIGDIIKIPDGWTAYIAWRDSEGYHLVGSWVTGIYQVQFEGEYAICIRLVTNDVLTESIDTIVSRFEIVTSQMVALKSDVKQMTDKVSIRHDYLESIARLGYDIAKDSTPPQQSILSYKEAYRHGYRIMLADVRWTSDLVPVAVHDATINAVARNADGTTISDQVAVSSSTLAQLNEYDFGIIKGDEYAGLKVMRIADFVPLCKKLNCEMYLEIKNLEGTIADISTEKLNALKAILDKYNIGNKCTFICDNNLQINKIHAVFPDARIGQVYTANVVGENLTKVINWLLAVKTDKNDVFLYLYDETVMTGQISNDLISLCVANGIGIEYTEVKTLAQLATWLTDENNLYCNRVAIRVQPIEYSLIDMLVN